MLIPIKILTFYLFPLSLSVQCHEAERLRSAVVSHKYKQVTQH